MTESPSWPEPTPTPEPAPAPEPEPRRLHPAAIVVYSASALGNLALPLAVILGMSVLGGDGPDLQRPDADAGVRRRRPRHRGDRRLRALDRRPGTGSTSRGHLPPHRAVPDQGHERAVRAHPGDRRPAGPAPALVRRVRASTSRPARAARAARSRCPRSLPEAVAELRGLRAVGACRRRGGGRASRARLTGRELAAAAVTAGQLGDRAPGARGARPGRRAGRRGGGRRERASGSSRRRSEGGCSSSSRCSCWPGLLSTLGAFVAFGGFTVTRGEDRLRIRRGLLAAARGHRAGRPRARGARGRGRASGARSGCARWPSRSRATRRRRARRGRCSRSCGCGTCARSWTRSCRSSPTTWRARAPADPRGAALHGAAAARRRAARRRPAGSSSDRGRWSRSARRAVRLGALARGGLALADGRLAVRSLRIARSTVLAPARFRESHTWAQNVFQRRAALADLVRGVRQAHDRAHPPPGGGGRG